MPEEAVTETVETDSETARPPTLDDLLAGLEEPVRQVIKEQVSKARKEAAKARQELREARPVIEAAKAAAEQGKSAEERAQEALTRATEREIVLRNRLVSAEVRALASAEFNDPADAEAFLDLGSFVDETGEVDTDAISTALDELLERKPHLRKAEDVPGARRPAPDLSQGAGAGRGSSSGLNGDPLLATLKQQLGIR